MKYIKNQSGMSLIAVLIVIAVASFLSASLFYFATTSINLTLIKERQKQADYLARTGIEATLKAWKEIGGSQIKTTTLPVYLMKDGSYETPVNGVPTDSVGYYQVSIDPNYEYDSVNHKVTTELTSTAVVGNTTATRKAITNEKMKMNDTLNVCNWYDIATGIPDNDAINASGNGNVASLNPSYNSLFKQGGDLPMHTGIFNGALLFPKPTSGYFEPATDGKYKFSARTIFFDMGIKFSATSGKDVSVVNFDAGDIVIGGDITISILEAGHGAVNTVILTCPPEYAHYLNDDPTGKTIADKKYGKVYFYGNVYFEKSFNGTINFSKLAISSGEGFYFDGSGKGVDLTKWIVDVYVDNGHGNSSSNGIKSIYIDGVGVTYPMTRVHYFDEITDFTQFTPPTNFSEGVIVWTK